MNPLFQERLNREALLALPEEHAEYAIRIHVHRNHSFELTASVLNPFLSLARARARYIYSPYDDSLAFADVEERADIHLLWLDAARYDVLDFLSWLRSRVAYLRSILGAKGFSPCRVIVAVAGLEKGARLDPMPDTLFLHCDEAVAHLGGAAYDARLEAFSGTRFSNQACLQLARELGTHAIPGMLFPSLKALVLDLDNTLHQGVLGEDGPQGAVPYMALQEHLVNLGKQGFFLALASRNEEEDVRRLFAERPDYPLKWEDFSARAIHWGPKSESLLALAQTLRIGPDAMLFVDDNHGERMEVSRALPEVRILPADGPEEVLAALRCFPGLRKNEVSLEDSVRSADLKANSVRERLRKTLSPEEYIRELGIVLEFAVDPLPSKTRVNELLHKTNQFIFTLLRPSQEEVDAYFTAGDKCVLTASMRDKLSDSGLIAVGLFSSLPGTLVLDELVVSCRALGRGVEDGLIRSLIHLAAGTLGAGPQLSVAYRTGPRNTPALTWLQSLAASPLDLEGIVLLPVLPSVSTAAVS